MRLGNIGVSDIASSVLALGYSGGQSANKTAGASTANVGVLSSIVRFPYPGYENLVINAPVDPGDSGGPVLNGNGVLVGMVRAARTTTGD